jgi:hypothetical protein
MDFIYECMALSVKVLLGGFFWSLVFALIGYIISFVTD